MASENVTANLVASRPAENATVSDIDIIFNMVSLTIIGFIGMFSNLFIVAVISKNKELQSPCFLLIAGECVTGFFVAAGMLENSIEEVAQRIGDLSTERTRGLCYMTKTFMQAWGIQANSVVTLTISLDRLVSILKPMKYKNLGKRYAYCCIGLCYLFATTSTVGGIFGSKTPGYAISDLIDCAVFFTPFTPEYLTFYGSFNLIVSVSCIFLYGVMLVLFERRRRRMVVAMGTSSSDRAFMKQQLACMPVIKLLMAYYAVTAAGPEIGVSIMSSSEAFRPYLPRYFYYSSVVKAMSALAEIFSLSFGSRQFRQCLKKMAGRMTDATVPTLSKGNAPQDGLVAVGT